MSVSSEIGSVTAEEADPLDYGEDSTNSGNAGRGDISQPSEAEGSQTEQMLAERGGSRFQGRERWVAWATKTQIANTGSRRTQP